MKRFALATGLSLLLTATALPQSYSRQGRATSRNPQTCLEISRFLGFGKDWLVYPTVDFSFGTQFQLTDQQFSPSGHSTSLVNTSDLTTIFRFAPRLIIYSDLTLDQITPPAQGKNSWLQSEGVFSSTLFLQYSDQFVTLGTGQFTPNFGIANNLAPGIFGGDFVSDYSFSDQLGVFAALDFGKEQIGRHILNGSLFTVDRSALSNSLFTRQGRTTAASGGPGNSGSLDSFCLAYNGIDVPICSLPILQYQLGFISQAAPQGSTARQQGYVAGLAATIPINRTATATAANRYSAIQPLLEYAHFDQWSSVNGATADYFTVGLEYFRGDWDLNASTTLRKTTDLPSQSAAHDLLAQATISYQLYGYQTGGGNGQISAGWSYSKDQGVDSNTFAIQLSLSWDIITRYQLLKGW